MAKQPDEEISGMGHFEIRLAEESLAEIKDPMASKRTVEFIMAATLRENRIRLSDGIMPVARNFHRRSPLKPEITKQLAEKSLAEAKRWASRSVGPMTPDELDNPPDSLWVSRLDFGQPTIMWALFTGKLTQLPMQRWQVLAYITSVNDGLEKRCPKLYDPTTTQSAQGQIDERTANTYVGGMKAGDRNAAQLKMLLESLKEYSDDGDKDAQVLFSLARCSSVTVSKINNNMKTYVRSR